ncbi:hypothetical protein NitYY0814_C0515 [Nitratiruptor sp. YY08-14]|nr:hypothetical protein NitYY0814_C0515 [Nitratiruptor sp. YY08-14]
MKSSFGKKLFFDIISPNVKASKNVHTLQKKRAAREADKSAMYRKENYSLPGGWKKLLYMQFLLG